MNVLLDAYAVVAFLMDEPAADKVAGLITEGSALSTVNAAESLDKMCRAGISPEKATEYLSGLDTEIVHPPVEVTIEAGLIRARNYHHRKRSVSMADCVAAAHAVHLGVPLATSDGPLAETVRAEEGSVIPLPDSRGIRPA